MATTLVNSIVSVSASIPTTVLSGASASATNGTAVDTANAEGNILAVIDSTAMSSGDTVDFTVEHSLDGSTNWAAVPASSLINATTGAGAATFTQVTASAASVQTLAIRKGLVKRYLRIVATYAGTSISGAYSGHFVLYGKVVNWTPS